MDFFCLQLPCFPGSTYKGFLFSNTSKEACLEYVFLKTGAGLMLQSILSFHVSKTKRHASSGCQTRTNSR